MCFCTTQSNWNKNIRTVIFKQQIVVVRQLKLLVCNTYGWLEALYLLKDRDIKICRKLTHYRNENRQHYAEGLLMSINIDIWIL